jgi:hypothetical protein
MKARRVFIGLNTLLVVVATIVLVPAWVLAEVPPSYNSYGSATGVHYIAGSDAFPNFEHGAINNRYPLAQVEQDASPSATAVATYADSGPLVATGGSAYNQGCTTGDKPPPKEICQNPNNQVPYAKSTYPGGPGKSHIDSCNNQGTCPAPSADSEAAQLNALASGYYSGGATAQQPFSGASGKTSTVVDQGGNLTVITHSEVQNWSMGNVQVSKVTVDVKAVSNLSGGSGEAKVTGGQVTINNQPVSVTDQGVTVQDKQIIPCASVPKPPPAPAPPVAPAPPPPPPPVVAPLGGLPVGAPGAAPSGGSSGGSSSGSSSGSPGGGPSGGGAAPSTCVPGVDITYFKFYTVAPTKTIDGSHVTVFATGLHIVVTHPTPGSGTPTQSTEYILGEGFADTTAGTGAGGSDFGLGAGFGDFGGFGGFDGSGFGADQNPVAGAAKALGTALVANRVPLAFMFLTLEALLLGAAAAWVWAKNTPVELIPGEVLSP